MPEFIVSIQAATARSAVLAAPVAKGDDASLVGAGAGLLIGQSDGDHGTVITAYRPQGPPAPLTEPGGVVAADWPDACALVIAADLRAIAAGYVAVPRDLAVGGLTWPWPVSCSYATPGKADPVITLTVSWVAASAAQASELLDSALNGASNDGDQVFGVGGGFLVVGEGPAGETDTAMIASGRAIVELNVPGDPAAARRLIPVVATRLRAIYPVSPRH